ncbi:hypothetical protein ACN47E_008185 [Coniothyrium glycines]
MLAVHQPQPIGRKKSLFRHFTFKEQRPTRPVRPVHPLALPIPPPSPSSRFASQPRSPRKLQRHTSNPPCTPPHSPRDAEQTNKFPKQHVKKSSIGKPQIIVQTYHVQLPSSDCENRPDHAQQSHLTRHDSSHSTSSNTSSAPRRVLPSDINTLPFSSHLSIAPWNIFLPPAQVHALYLGALPRHPSDKWAIYSEGPDALGKLKVHFHRSWTGLKIAEVFVVMDVKGEGAGKIVGVKWNGGSETNQMSEGEAKWAVREGCTQCLGVKLEEGR